MKKLKILVGIASVVVLLICVYAFLAGNEVFTGNFSNSYWAWYFLAKGIFCSICLYLLVLILNKLDKKQ